MKKMVYIAAAVMTLSAFSGIAEAKGKRSKVKYSEAKKMCLQETPDLAGKDLKACIKTKQK